MEMLANGSIDGFIMSLSTETQAKNDYNHIKEVTSQGIPLVMFDRVTDEVECDKVIIDDRDSAYKAVKKLIDSGRRNIALINTENLSVSNARTEGYYQALQDGGIPINKDLVLTLPFESIDEAAIQHFFDTVSMDAVLCVNEIFAIYGMRVVQKKGLKIPEDVSFIGFTDGPLSKYANPSLSAVAQHGESMGAIAAQMLIDKVENEEEEEVYRTEILDSTLIERESTIN